MWLERKMKFCCLKLLRYSIIRYYTLCYSHPSCINLRNVRLGSDVLWRWIPISQGLVMRKIHILLCRFPHFWTHPNKGANHENLAAVGRGWGGVGGGNNSECNNEAINPKGMQATLPHNSLAETSQMLTTVGPGSTISTWFWRQRWKQRENNINNQYSFQLISFRFLSNYFLDL